MRKEKWLAVAVLLCWASVARGQQPNLEAHRLYFVAVTSWIDKDANTAAKAIRSYLNTAGVAEPEHGAAFKALAKFKNRYEALIDAYNHSPSTIAGNSDDQAAFLAMLDMVTQDTIELLRASLSEDSFNHLTERVRLDGLNIHSAGAGLTSEHRHGTKFLPAQNGMTPHYSASRSGSVSWDANGNATVYETPVVSGYTSCSYCPYNHYGFVENTLNGGAPVQGPNVSAPSYISVSNGQQAQFLSGCFSAIFPEECNMTFDEEAKVHCNGINGYIYNWSNPFSDFHFKLEAAVTFSQVTGWPSPNVATLQDWCQLAYEPPDYNPNILLNAQAGATYVLGGAVLLNSTWNSGFWLVVSPGIATSLTGTYTRKYCTHNIPPY